MFALDLSYVNVSGQVEQNCNTASTMEKKIRNNYKSEREQHPVPELVIGVPKRAEKRLVFDVDRGHDALGLLVCRRRLPAHFRDDCPDVKQEASVDLAAVENRVHPALFSAIRPPRLSCELVVQIVIHSLRG